MKWHPPIKHYTQGEWRPWFAWYPVRAKLSSLEKPQPYEAPWRWAWWEWVETRYDSVRSYEIAFNEYRTRA